MFENVNTDSEDVGGWRQRHKTAKLYTKREDVSVETLATETD